MVTGEGGLLGLPVVRPVTRENEAERDNVMILPLCMVGRIV